MAKKKLYLFSLLVATMSVLLSTVVMHHHHMGRICMVVERCQQDGKLNDEHTEHHENENDGCRVRWQQFAASLPCVDETAINRRGPPSFC